ncbi:hypothetical protein [Streptomyces sp. NPDC127092]|uniref:hypothetical protein n=1 Tax=Streptomyces sp. NPDC127092 TaxID=3347135 RepID=UPI0036611638
MAEIALTNTGLDAFLEASPEFRAPGAVRAADAVLSLLALRGADRGTGVPEPTPALAKELLLEDLPAFVCAPPDELGTYPAVLRALAARFDGERRSRVEGAVGEAVADFERAMADPGNLTWPRWYAQLLRADGTDHEDPEAVRAWLAGLDGPPLPDGVRRADLMGRTAVADLLLAEVLTRAYVRDAERPPAAGPLLGDHDVAQGIGTVAAALLDRWTAAGLAEGLAGEYAHLAPGPDDFPHLALADALLDEHLDYYGDPSVPLPPPETEAAGDDVERDADLLAAVVDELAEAEPYATAAEPYERVGTAGGAGGAGAAGGAGTAGGAGAAGVAGGARAAVGAGSVEGAGTAEGAGVAGTAGGAATGKAAGAAGSAGSAGSARVARVAATEPDGGGAGPRGGGAGPYGGEAAHLLYTLYQRGCSAESVARRAAEFEDWTVDPALEDAPVRVPPPASPAYTTPTAGELARLLGSPGINDTDRARLDKPAHELAAVVDRLAATGLVFRHGDAFGLTPRGRAVVRYLLAVRRVAVPDAAETAGWDAARLVEAAAGWPPAVAGRVLADWLRARSEGAGAWGELLDALGTVDAGTSEAAATRALLGLLDWSAAPAEALRDALSDPVAGARAEEALLARGDRVGPGVVPDSARALRVLDGLPGKKGPLETRRAAFDAAAARWPGGSAALVAAMAAADPHETARVLGPLGVSLP